MAITKHVYIIHGYLASPTDHWFQWLKSRLLADSINADVLKMPSPEQPRMTEWVEEISLHSHNFNKDTYFVAHSLGCASLLRYLEKLSPSERVGGIVLVSGFTKHLPNLPILDEFTTEPFDFNKIMAAAESRSVIASRNDEIVPNTFSKELADHIQAEFYDLDEGGHFLGSDGFTSFPLVYELLTRELKAGHSC